MTGALRVLEHHLTVYRRTWKGSLFMSFLSPILFLAAMGLGLGSLISRGPVRTIDGVSYLVTLLFGTVHSVLAVLAIVVAILTGLAFAAPILSWTATRRTDQSFALIGRFLITPLFLLGGVFFPLHQLPQVIQGIAWLTPLAHGVALARSLSLGVLAPSAGIHLAVLLLYAAIGITAARITLQRRLVQ